MMVAAIVCAVSCGDPEGPAVVDPESISTVKTSYIIGSEGGRLEVSVLTNVDITVECAEPWVECVVTKAAENRTVKVTVQENPSTGNDDQPLDRPTLEKHFHSWSPNNLQPNLTFTDNLWVF